ncbi:hypothetical protein, partial [Serratia marcescens]|uniref:hypothetical protein n=1 Tax=Serratia marcescens TaxID=615 RepID=UPI0028134E8E
EKRTAVVSYDKKLEDLCQAINKLENTNRLELFKVHNDIIDGNKVLHDTTTKQFEKVFQETDELKRQISAQTSTINQIAAPELPPAPARQTQKRPREYQHPFNYPKDPGPDVLPGRLEYWIGGNKESGSKPSGSKKKKLKSIIERLDKDYQ